jgi:2,4-dienoyl-CoA reductase-like NADH-dependent reductase (Old Yellow Enzyme family)
MNAPNAASDSMKGLFAPLPLGRKTAPNRFVFAAHQTNFATHNRFTERHAAYYEARAAGGVGLIVLEGSVVHPSDWPYEYAVFGDDAAVVDGYRGVADAVHRHGALALAQLTHSGMQGSSHYSQRCRCGRRRRCRRSTAASCRRRWGPKTSPPSIEGFRQAARYAGDGGLDGVEINAGQDSLIRQFLSPLTNQRTISTAARWRTGYASPVRSFESVRNELGRAAIVGLRLVGDEYAPWAGIKPEDAAEIARLLGGRWTAGFHQRHQRQHLHRPRHPARSVSTARIRRPSGGGHQGGGRAPGVRPRQHRGPRHGGATARGWAGRRGGDDPRLDRRSGTADQAPPGPDRRHSPVPARQPGQHHRPGAEPTPQLREQPGRRLRTRGRIRPAEAGPGAASGPRGGRRAGRSGSGAGRGRCAATR